MNPQDYAARRQYRPPSSWYQRLNWLGVLLTSLGLGPRDAVTLQVRGRASGKLRRLPILRTHYRDEDYLVTLAGESQWVRNVRAAHGHAVIRRRRTCEVRLEELAPTERPEIIAEYLRAGHQRSGAEANAKQARYYFGLDASPSLDDIRTIVDYYPVFRVLYSGSAVAAGREADSRPLMDQVLPTYDYAVVHADVLRAPPDQCYRAASELDLFQSPLARTLLGLRGLPQGVADTLRGRGKKTTPGTSRRTFRFKDLVGLGWILLGETPGVELVLGQVSRPWKAVAATTEAPATPEQFTSFDEPGLAKIAASLRIDPHGNGSSILTLETRVALTDDLSRHRFRRYWLFVGPLSSLIRRMALHLLAAELRQSVPGRPDDRCGT